jgi:hypothetical protein
MKGVRLIKQCGGHGRGETEDLMQKEVVFNHFVFFFMFYILIKM